MSQDKYKPKSPQMNFKYNFDELEISHHKYDNHKRMVDEIWDKTMNSNAKSNKKLR